MTAGAALPQTAYVDAAELIEDALEYAAGKMRFGSAEGAVEAIGSGDVNAYLYFRYCLAKKAYQMVASLAEMVNRAYLFGETHCDSIPGEPITLVLVVPKKTAALTSLVKVIRDRVQRAINNRFQASKTFDGFVLLNIRVLDGKDLLGKQGFAAALDSIHEPPLVLS